jgi:hypothetical protein
MQNRHTPRRRTVSSLSIITANNGSNTASSLKIGQLKAASVLLASIALAACSGSESASATAASTNTSIDGVWRVCEVDGADSDQFVVDSKSGTLCFQITKHFGNITCSNANGDLKPASTLLITRLAAR